MRESEIAAAFRDRGDIDAVAIDAGISPLAVELILMRAGLLKEGGRTKESKKVGHVQKPRQHAGTHARFKPYKAPGGMVEGLAVDHPAVVEGRTLFPGNVVKPLDSPRLLIDGKNNPKTGGKVTKGEWAGMPIFTLTLQERATCPRYCDNWRRCYGNTMQWPRRHDASDEDFIVILAGEVITVARQHPNGLVIRLHVLGDFFSAQYVRAWRLLMETLPMLRVWGYTARRADAGDAEIADLIAGLNEDFPDRWVVRTSHVESGPMRAIVVPSDPKLPDVIVCPAQVEKTACCASCGLCWAAGAKDKTIAFLAHGAVGKPNER